MLLVLLPFRYQQMFQGGDVVFRASRLSGTEKSRQHPNGFGDGPPLSY